MLSFHMKEIIVGIWDAAGNKVPVFFETSCFKELHVSNVRSNIWPHDAKSWLTRKDPDAGEDWRQEEMGMTEDEMAG